MTRGAHDVRLAIDGSGAAFAAWALDRRPMRPGGRRRSRRAAAATPACRRRRPSAEHRARDGHARQHLARPVDQSRRDSRRRFGQPCAVADRHAVDLHPAAARNAVQPAADHGDLPGRRHSRRARRVRRVLRTHDRGRPDVAGYRDRRSARPALGRRTAVDPRRRSSSRRPRTSTASSRSTATRTFRPSRPSEPLVTQLVPINYASAARWSTTVQVAAGPRLPGPRPALRRGTERAAELKLPAARQRGGRHRRPTRCWSPSRSRTCRTS